MSSNEMNDIKDSDMSGNELLSGEEIKVSEIENEPTAHLQNAFKEFQEQEKQWASQLSNQEDVQKGKQTQNQLVSFFIFKLD